MTRLHIRSWMMFFTFALSVASAPGRAQAAQSETASRNLIGPVVLVDNGAFITHPGGGAGGADVSALQNGAFGMTILGFGDSLSSGFRIADDFTAADPGRVGCADHHVLRLSDRIVDHLDDRSHQPPDLGMIFPGDVLSTVVFGNTTTNVFSSSAWTNVYRTTLTTLSDVSRPIMATIATAVVHLDPGTYWIDWRTAVRWRPAPGLLL